MGNPPEIKLWPYSYSVLSKSLVWFRGGEARRRMVKMAKMAKMVKMAKMAKMACGKNDGKRVQEDGWAERSQWYGAEQRDHTYAALLHASWPRRLLLSSGCVKKTNMEPDPAVPACVWWVLRSSRALEWSAAPAISMAEIIIHNNYS